MANDDQGEVTRLLRDLNDSPELLEQVTAMVYQDIHKLAHRQRHQLGSSPTLRTTALAHEAFLKIFHNGHHQANDRVHMMRLLARAMRQIIVDHARQRLSKKRGQGAPHLELNDEVVAEKTRQQAAAVIDMERALEQLERIDSNLAEMVSAHFYGGLTTEEIAEIQGKSRRTVQRDFKRAFAWLRMSLESGSD